LKTEKKALENHPLCPTA